MPIYMKVPGVEGPVKGKYKGWIELESFELGTPRYVSTPSGHGTGQETSAPPITNVVVTKGHDITSADLSRLATGGIGKKVQIDFVAKDSKNDVPHLSIELEDMLISNFNISGSSSDPRGEAVETLTLNFTKIVRTASATVSPRGGSSIVGGWGMHPSRGS